MAIDADLSAGLIDDKEAQRRRRELEEESAFFGSMDGASKFVRGEAIAGIIIIAVNIFGGIVIGVTRHGMTLSRRGRRLHPPVGRRRPGVADPGADHLARRRPAGLQGRHARIGRAGGARPAQRLSARAVRRRGADVRARRWCRACRCCPSRSLGDLLALRRLHHPAPAPRTVREAAAAKVRARGGAGARARRRTRSRRR